ncbi:MAG TPA: hypothetical protein VGN93_27720 [Shinella sp.]|jgi:hypothetical protein|uniref:hypothetical protein n=1 Tax=Shinella sp. TaxID=1870904 RepID=UPI002E1559C3|nr:hypothetical protein [Shinella sp.]
MAPYYFPILFWTPSAVEDANRGDFSLVCRKWGVSIFDLYSLVAEKHPIRLPVELMQIFLAQVNLEILVDADDYEKACRKLNVLRAILYSQGISPTLAPFATNYSLNSYAGINARSSGSSVDRLHEGLRHGITITEAKIEGWPNELSLMCLRGDLEHLTNNLTCDAFVEAASAVPIWQSIEDKYPAVRNICSALAKAPLMPDLSSSILHIWQALESLFRIESEITYRTSILLAELCAPIVPRASTYAIAKKSYGDRSKIAHGSNLSVDTVQWMRAWGLLRITCQAILQREALPSADDLLNELLMR